MDDGAFDWRCVLEPRFGAALRRFFRRRIGNMEEAQDLTQEVFVRILNQSSAPQVDNPDAYVFTAASNLLREHARRAQVRGSRYSGMVPEAICDLLHEGVEGFSPERIIAGKEAVNELMVALNELHDRTRAIFLLHRLEGMAQKDIARQLGISVSAVEKHIAKAMVHLAKKIER